MKNSHRTARRAGLSAKGWPLSAWLDNAFPPPYLHTNSPGISPRADFIHMSQLQRMSSAWSGVNLLR